MAAASQGGVSQDCISKLILKCGRLRKACSEDREVSKEQYFRNTPLWVEPVWHLVGGLKYFLLFHNTSDDGPIKVTPQKDIQDHTRLEFATILLVKALFVMIITL